jgi:hypothetical protein
VRERTNCGHQAQIRRPGRPSDFRRRGSAAILRTKGVDVEETLFETWPPPPDAFQLVYAAQAWHWVHGDDRYERVAAGTHSHHRMLKPEVREELARRVGAAIDRHGGRVEVIYDVECYLSRRVSPRV